MWSEEPECEKTHDHTHACCHPHQADERNAVMKVSAQRVHEHGEAYARHFGERGHECIDRGADFIVYAFGEEEVEVRLERSAT